VPAGGAMHPAPRAARASQPAGTTTGTWGASLELGQASATSQEAWPDAEPVGALHPAGESRGRTPEGERVPQDARRNDGCGGCDVRLSAFRLLFAAGDEGSEKNSPSVVAKGHSRSESQNLRRETALQEGSPASSRMGVGHRSYDEPQA
jgi:hypothetical protein